MHKKLYCLVCTKNLADAFSTFFFPVHSIILQSLLSKDHKAFWPLCYPTAGKYSSLRLKKHQGLISRNGVPAVSMNIGVTVSEQHIFQTPLRQMQNGGAGGTPHVLQTLYARLLNFTLSWSIKTSFVKASDCRKASGLFHTMNQCDLSNKPPWFIIWQNRQFHNY